MYVCMDGWMDVWMYVCMHACVYVYMLAEDKGGPSKGGVLNNRFF